MISDKRSIVNVGDRVVTMLENVCMGEAPITSLFTVEIQLVGETKVNDRKLCVYPVEWRTLVKLRLELTLLFTGCETWIP